METLSEGCGREFGAKPVKCVCGAPASYLIPMPTDWASDDGNSDNERRQMGLTA